MTSDAGVDHRDELAFASGELPCVRQVERALWSGRGGTLAALLG
ncbi:hypothetical protein ABZW96_19000 [Nocardia sp. NPDC004168]